MRIVVDMVVLEDVMVRWSWLMSKSTAMLNRIILLAIKIVSVKVRYCWVSDGEGLIQLTSETEFDDEA